MMIMGGPKKSIGSILVSRMFERERVPHNTDNYYGTAGKTPEQLDEWDGVNTANKSAFEAFVRALDAKDHKNGMRAFKAMIDMHKGNRVYYDDKNDDPENDYGQSRSMY